MMELPPRTLLNNETLSLFRARNPTKTPTDHESPKVFRVSIVSYSKTTLEDQVNQQTRQTLTGKTSGECVSTKQL